MTGGRAAHTASLLPNGKVLVAGGAYGNSSYLSSAELYDPATGAWTNTGSLNSIRVVHTATLLPNGKVMVAGGADSFNYHSSAELYDPATGTWTNTGSMTTIRGYHTASSLPSGKVLVAGGYNFEGSLPNYLSSAELYDPATGTWTATGTMHDARVVHTTTLLPNGQLLVAGGTPDGTTALASAELYDVGLGFSASWQPTIATATSPLNLGSSLTLTGSKFRGISEGSGGNTSQDSSADYPVVQLRSLGNEQTLFLLTTKWSTNSFTSLPVTNFPPGWALATVFVNGIPSTSAILRVDPPAILLINPTRLANGAFQFAFTNSTGATFTALATTNVALPIGTWTTLGAITEIAPGQFQFTDPQATNHLQRFYRVSSP